MYSAAINSTETSCPDNFISPVQLSGSAVETLFSQFKHTSGSKLISTNYSIAKAAHLVKHSVSYHDGSKGYQDVPVHLSESVLEKKKYGSSSKA